MRGYKIDRGSSRRKRNLFALLRPVLLVAVLATAAYLIFRPAPPAPGGANLQSGDLAAPFAFRTTTPGIVAGDPNPQGAQEATTQPVVATADPGLPLKGRRVGLDPGHGPREDMGAVLVSSDGTELILSEAEFNLDIALRSRAILEARGASVVLTRESEDTFTAPWPADVNGDGKTGEYSDDLQLRVDILNNFGAEAFLSIHANGGERNTAARQDVQVLYCGAPDCVTPDRNRQLSQLVLDRLLPDMRALGYPVGGEILTDLAIDSSDPPQHLFVLGPTNGPRHVRATSMPGALAESLYITYEEHAALLKRDDVRQMIAGAYADALQAFLTGTGE